GLCHARLRLQQLAKSCAGHRCDEAARSCLHTCRSRAAADRGELAENFAGGQLAKAYRLSDRRIDRDADFAEHDEEHVIRSIEIADDRLARCIAPPSAAPLDPVERVGGEPCEDSYPLQRLLRLRALRKCHYQPQSLHHSKRAEYKPGEREWAGTKTAQAWAKRPCAGRFRRSQRESWWRGMIILTSSGWS